MKAAFIKIAAYFKTAWCRPKAKCACSKPATPSSCFPKPSSLPTTRIPPNTAWIAAPPMSIARWTVNGSAPSTIPTARPYSTKSLAYSNKPSIPLGIEGLFLLVHHQFNVPRLGSGGSAPSRTERGARLRLGRAQAESARQLDSVPLLAIGGNRKYSKV